MDGWIENRQTDEQMDKWINRKQMDVWMENRQMMDRWMGGQKIDECIYVQMYGWMDKWMPRK